MLTATKRNEAKPAKEQRHPVEFRCCLYYQKSTKLYVAECLDLDLMVKAPKEKKARRHLEEAISGHVKVALESGELSLLRRPSPLTHWIWYYLTVLRSHLSNHVRAFCFAPEYVRRVGATAPSADCYN